MPYYIRVCAAKRANLREVGFDTTDGPIPSKVQWHHPILHRLQIAPRKSSIRLLRGFKPPQTLIFGVTGSSAGAKKRMAITTESQFGVCPFRQTSAGRDVYLNKSNGWLLHNADTVVCPLGYAPIQLETPKRRKPKLNRATLVLFMTGC